MTRILLFATMIVLTSSSCVFLGGKRVRGNGNITSVERSVSSFSEVEVHGAIDMYVIQGSEAPVRIEGDENLIEYIQVKTEGNRLEVRTRPGYNLRPTKKMKVYVTSPNYTELEVSGACNIYGERSLNLNNPIAMSVSGAGDIRMDITSPKVKARVSGSGNVDMKGQTKDLEIDISGAGEARCYDLLSENTKVEISGAGSAEVYASVFLDAHVSGAGSVRYRGNAGKVNQQVSGAGSVKKAE